MNCKKCTTRLTKNDYEETPKGTVITCSACGHSRLIPSYPDPSPEKEPSTLARIVIRQIQEDHKPKQIKRMDE